MKIVMINGSPKGKDSTSGRIIAALRDNLSDVSECVVHELTKRNAAETVNAIRNSDALVFVFPLYVDGIPSGLVRFLEEVRSNVTLAAPRAKVYAVVHNGFYDARQNAIAIDMMESFCESSRLAWGRGLGVGGGGMISAVPLGRFPLKKIGVAFDTLTKNIRDLETAENHFVEPDIPRFLYKLAANFGMRKEMKKEAKK